MPRKSVVRLTDRPDMILDVYRGGNTTTQEHKNRKWIKCMFNVDYPVTDCMGNGCSPGCRWWCL